jgi:hypothetical protein
MTVLGQCLQDPSGHLARASNDPAKLLAGDLDLHAIRVGHGIRFLAQFEQGMGNPAGYIEEGEIADLAAGLAQTRGKLRGQFQQDVRVFLGQGAEPAVADLGHLAFTACTYPGAAVGVLTEQSHFPEESAGIDIGQDDFVSVLVLHQDANRAADDVVQHVGLVPGVDDHAFARVFTPVAMLQKACHAGVYHPRDMHVFQVGWYG